MEKQQWALEIRPVRPWYSLDLKEIWRYRDLYFMYIKRDIIVQYKQTVLGPLWYLLQPACTTLIYMLVFGGLAGISTDGIPQALFYMSGIMLWNYFSTVFSATSSLFLYHAPIFGKVYFPRLIVPLATATSNLLKFLIQMGLFLCIYIYFIYHGADICPNVTLLLLPILVAELAVMAISSGLIISALTTKYRDMTLLVSFGVQLFMYATPVVYPISATPERYRDLIMLNPLSPIFEAVRYMMMGCGAIYWDGLIYSACFSIGILLVALVFFSRTERTFMDSI